jgi:hypothetical protein
MGRRERRRQQLLDDLEETKRYWKLNGEALDSTLWGASLRRGYEPFARHSPMLKATHVFI